MQVPGSNPDVGKKYLFQKLFQLCTFLAMIVINDNVPMISLMTSLPMIVNNTIVMITINVIPMTS